MNILLSDGRYAGYRKERGENCAPFLYMDDLISDSPQPGLIQITLLPYAIFETVQFFNFGRLFFVGI